MKSSKAIGPDGISHKMLQKLGTHGMNILTRLLNLSVKTATMPSIWKTGKIIPLLKPNKQADDSKSYRPISLLSPIAKVLEKLILPHLSAAIKLAEHQHGFTKNRSTMTALHTINSMIADGLNRKKPVERTISVALDLSKAFDTVDHEQLKEDILNLDLNPSIKNGLSVT